MTSFLPARRAPRFDMDQGFLIFSAMHTGSHVISMASDPD
jgi:hypothetical protein